VVRACFATVFLSAIAACGTTHPVTIPVTESRYDTIAPAVASDFQRARAAWNAGDAHGARSAFEALAQREPENIVYGVWAQESALAAIARDSADNEAARAPREALFQRYVFASEEHPNAASCFLAARLDPDPKSAERRLERALELDPKCAWAHYGLAFQSARDSDWTRARERLARAKAADPGHMPSYWLEAWILTRRGSVEDAASAWTGWLERARDDDAVLPSAKADAELDLALLWMLAGEPRKSRDLLDQVDQSVVDRSRRFSAIACVEQALGDIASALAAAESAEKVRPGAVLPALQQALLLDEWVEDPVRAELAWKHVLTIARGSSQLIDVLERTRARVRLERYDAERARKAATGAAR
jgi:predicted Zn-dependent protease